MIMISFNVTGEKTHRSAINMEIQNLWSECLKFLVNADSVNKEQEKIDRLRQK